MKILYYIYQICIAFTYPIGIDYSYSDCHHCRLFTRRELISGDTIRAKYGHNSSVFFC